MLMSKKVSERLIQSIPTFKQVLKIAKDRDVNEADTVSIIKDIFADIFGYDKYLDLTSEFAIRNTFCDLAIKFNNKVEYLVEIKAVGLELKEGHLRQAIEYGSNHGVPWIILTNGVYWEIYKIQFEQPINYKQICTFNFEELDSKNQEHLEKLFIICKEGLVKDAREEYFDRSQILNRYTLSALIQSDEIISVIRKELRKISDGMSVNSEELIKILNNEVIKRDVLEGEEAVKAQTKIKRYYSKNIRKTKIATPTNEISTDISPINELTTEKVPSDQQTKEENV